MTPPKQKEPSHKMVHDLVQVDIVPPVNAISSYIYILSIMASLIKHFVHAASHRYGKFKRLKRDARRTIHTQETCLLINLYRRRRMGCEFSLGEPFPRAIISNISQNSKKLLKLPTIPVQL